MADVFIDKPKSLYLDSILGQKFPVLNDGFIRVVDYMGNDSAIVQAARVSCGKGTKKANEDERLINYLVRHKHTTPLEMCELKLHLRVPMDCWRQFVRHRTASINERSSRYSIIDDGAQVIPIEEWRQQSKNNKQGSGENFPAIGLGQEFSKQEKEIHNLSLNIYKDRIKKGMAREQARKDLPLCSYTEAYWKIDLHNLLHFLNLRMDPFSQKEIREYALIIGEKIVSKWVPATWKAFNNHILHSKSFSMTDLLLLRMNKEDRIKKAINIGWLPEDYTTEGYKDKKLPQNSERNEFIEKSKKIGQFEVF